jgi:WD40 repeat protein
LAFSADGRYLASSSFDHSVRLWELRSACEVANFRRPAAVFDCVVFSPDGRTLAAGASDLSIRLRDVASWKQRMLLDFHRGPVKAMALAPDGTKLAAVTSPEGDVQIWDMEGKACAAWETKSQLMAVSMLPDRNTDLTAGEEGVIRLWDSATGHEQPPWHGHTAIVRALACAADGRRVASGGGDFGYRSQLLLWDPASGKAVNCFKDRHDPVTCLAFSPNGKMFVSGEGNAYKRRGAIGLWDAQAGRPMALCRVSDVVTALAISPDGKRLAAAVENEIRLWRIADLLSPEGKSK